MRSKKSAKTPKVKAVALMSGGLDSSLAARMMVEQGIDLIGVQIGLPLKRPDREVRNYAAETAAQLDIPFKTIPAGKNYLRILRNPKFGYGSAVNPCVDCHIFMFREAWKYARKVGAKFLVTGEVLKQRPMSQFRNTLLIIEREAGLPGKILRPLSARLLPPTEAEEQGWVDREKLQAIEGRGRRIQFDLAERWRIRHFSTPAGGCILTMGEFAKKMKDLRIHNRNFSWNDFMLLKAGRHFRFGANKIIVGRNKEENEFLLANKNKTDWVFRVPDFGSPITILQGRKTGQAVKTAARLTALYSDHQGPQVLVLYGKQEPVTVEIVVNPAERCEAHLLNLTVK